MNAQSSISYRRFLAIRTAVSPSRRKLKKKTHFQMTNNHQSIRLYLTQLEKSVLALESKKNRTKKKIIASLRQHFLSFLLRCSNCCPQTILNHTRKTKYIFQFIAALFTISHLLIFVYLFLIYCRKNS